MREIARVEDVRGSRMVLFGRELGAGRRTCALFGKTLTRGKFRWSTVGFGEEHGKGPGRRGAHLSDKSNISGGGFIRIKRR